MIQKARLAIRPVTLLLLVIALLSTRNAHATDCYDLEWGSPMLVCDWDLQDCIWITHASAPDGCNNCPYSGEHYYRGPYGGSCSPGAYCESDQMPTQGELYAACVGQ